VTRGVRVREEAVRVDSRSAVECFNFQPGIIRKNLEFTILPVGFSFKAGILEVSISTLLYVIEQTELARRLENDAVRKKD